MINILSKLVGSMMITINTYMHILFHDDSREKSHSTPFKNETDLTYDLTLDPILV